MSSDSEPGGDDRRTADEQQAREQQPDEQQPDEQHREPDIEQPRKGADRWVVRGVLLLVGAALAFVIYQVAASFLPRWWAQHVGGQVNGKVTAGTMWGLFYGFVFTCIPALIVFQARRKFLRIKGRIAVVVLGLLLATPNWLTLFVVLGGTDAAHAGERIFDVEAPGFRWATSFGALAGMFIAASLSGTAMWLRHRKRQVNAYKADAKDRKAREEAERAEAERRAGASEGADSP